MSLDGRVILITNVPKFAGRATTRAALAKGALVLASDASFADAGARAAFETEFAGAKALAAQAPADVAAEALAARGHVDALVNNDAYPALRQPLEEADLGKFRDALETMVIAPYALTQALAPAMRKRKRGRIVFVSSAAPLRGLANYSPYVSARNATLGLVSSLAKELGRDNITVNAVGSNYVENPNYFPPALLADREAMAKMTANIPLRRLGKPEELAETILFLCSDGAGFVTGHVLPHAGGWA